MILGLVILLNLVRLSHQLSEGFAILICTFLLENGGMFQFTYCRRGASVSVSVLYPTNSVALVRERTIPTERPPLVGEFSANFCG
jgi:hypothetical protein